MSLFSILQFEYFADFVELIGMFIEYVLGLSDRFADLISTVHNAALVIITIVAPFGNSAFILGTLISIVIVLRIFGRY